MSSFAREQIYYEIAMSIGNSLDMKVMLKEGLSTYLRKLNCLAGAVVRRTEDGEGNYGFELVYAIPKRMRRHGAIARALEQLPSGLNAGGLATYLASLPSVDDAEGSKRYVMELPGYGLLILIKSAPGLSVPEAKSLARINNKLAGACLSCDANEKLQQEIQGRRLAEDKYRSIFNNAVEGIFQSTMDGRFLEVNPAMARLLGFDSPEDVVSNYTNLADQLYVDPEARNRMLHKLERVGRVSGFEIQYCRRDGSTGWLSISTRLVRDEQGVPIYLEGAADDITTRKMALTSLREAKQEAERLSQMKSNFLSMVSHELRTPLTAVLGFAKITRKKMTEVLGSESGCPEKTLAELGRVARNTDVIIAEGERLTELINNVLDLAKLEAGFFEWNMEDVSMNHVLEHSLAATGILFEESEVALKVDVAPELPVVSGDRDRLIQVVINLLSNAAKFTEKGTVSLEAYEEEGEVVTKVLDTGLGVPADQVNVIFDKFRQLGNTLTDKPRGTGLGLPITKEIVEYHNGRLWYEPNPGGGSVFAFALPAKQAD